MTRQDWLMKGKIKFEKNEEKKSDWEKERNDEMTRKASMKKRKATKGKEKEVRSKKEKYNAVGMSMRNEYYWKRGLIY